MTGPGSETYEAYVDVWTRVSTARQHFAGWPSFTQAANREPAQAREHLERVRLAEQLLGEAGYELGPLTSRGARQWLRREAEQPPS